MALKQSSSLFFSALFLFLFSVLFVSCAGEDPPEGQLSHCLQQCERVQQDKTPLAFCRRQCRDQFGQGKNNIVSLMEKEAKELSFDLPASEVGGIFGNQDLEIFLPGPKKEHGSI